MEIQKKLITPAKALELLQANVKNRTLKSDVVNKYTRDISLGKWKSDTFELIKISKNGVILDGQHRLHAVVKANIPVYFHIVEGLEEGIIDVLDTGSVRSSADVFKINQIKNSAVIPSIIAFYDAIGKGATSQSLKVYQKKTNADLLAEYNSNPEKWQNIATQTHTLYNNFGKILPPSFIGGFLAFFNSINYDDSQRFMSQFCSGKNVENETINMLRMKLVNDKVAIKKYNNSVKQVFTIKTWNAFRRGQNLKMFKYDPNVESFPIAI